MTLLGIDESMNSKIRVTVKVHPKSSQKKIVEKDGVFHVYVNDAPENGKANASVILMLAQKFNTTKSSIEIVSGATSRLKLIDIYFNESV